MKNKPTAKLETLSFTADELVLVLNLIEAHDSDLCDKVLAQSEITAEP